MQAGAPVKDLGVIKSAGGPKRINLAPAAAAAAAPADKRKRLEALMGSGDGGFDPSAFDASKKPKTDAAGAPSAVPAFLQAFAGDNKVRRSADAWICPEMMTGCLSGCRRTGASPLRTRHRPSCSPLGATRRRRQSSRVTTPC